YDVTWYSAVPTIHQILLGRADQDGAPRGGLRFIRSCSSALAPATFQQMEERFGAPVLEAYGMTEASHQMASNPLPPGPRKPGFVGKGTGEEVHAAVVLKAEATPEEIQAFCRDRLADFKVPKVIHVTEAVPRTATGKVQRRHVAAHFLKG